MATGRTVAAAFLTETDSAVIRLGERISNILRQCISDDRAQRDFQKNYGKISFTRDAGTGRGAGKLQRDAFCTRGRQGKAPFSNRNLRWHPLVVADKPISFAEPIDHIELQGDKALVFFINGRPYYAEQVYELPNRYVVLPEHWIPHVDILKNWTDSDWTANSCVIPALEAADWWHALETFVVLGLSVIGTLFRAKQIERVGQRLAEVLSSQDIEPDIVLPTQALNTILENPQDLLMCPLCKSRLDSNVADLSVMERESVWQPRWRGGKRGEGEDRSIQIMHMNPLSESVIRHTAENVRYGHRWCNVSMTDHSIDDTLDFMEHVARVHGRCG